VIILLKYENKTSWQQFFERKIEILILKGLLFRDLSLSLIYFTIDKYENKTSWQQLFERKIEILILK